MKTRQNRAIQQRAIAFRSRVEKTPMKTPDTDSIHALPHFRRPRWMVVDDNEDFLPILREVLGHLLDADICCFCDPAEAVRTFEAMPDAFQFVITDFDMPGMNGFELGEHLHRLVPGLPIILASGNFELNESDVLQRGFSRLLHKPFRLVDLCEAIDAVQHSHRPAEFSGWHCEAA
jgi:CheY-like chemotaxis protein